MSTALRTEASAKLSDKINAAERELSVLDSHYADLAADVGLMGASMLPPPAGTAADLASLGKSLATGDYVGALFDTIGFVPLIGDGIKGLAKGTKALDRLNDLRKAIDSATAGLARARAVVKRGNLDEMAAALERSGELLEVRKAAATRYWDEIAEAGQKRYDEAIQSCAAKKCDSSAALLKGDHYRYTPVNGGSWRNGARGDGEWVPEPDSDAALALAEFNGKFRPDAPPLDAIPYQHGHPDFSELTVPIPDSKGRASVEILQTGDNAVDFAAADKALKKATGFDKASLEASTGMDFTWHHAPDGTTMQLVPMEAHGARYGVGHAGGASTVQSEGY